MGKEDGRRVCTVHVYVSSRYGHLGWHGTRESEEPSLSPHVCLESIKRSYLLQCSEAGVLPDFSGEREGEEEGDRARGSRILRSGCDLPQKRRISREMLWHSGAWAASE